MASGISLVRFLQRGAASLREYARYLTNSCGESKQCGWPFIGSTWLPLRLIKNARRPYPTEKIEFPGDFEAAAGYVGEVDCGRSAKPHAVYAHCYLVEQRRSIICSLSIDGPVRQPFIHSRLQLVSGHRVKYCFQRHPLSMLPKDFRNEERVQVFLDESCRFLAQHRSSNSTQEQRPVGPDDRPNWRSSRRGDVSAHRPRARPQASPFRRTVRRDTDLYCLSNSLPFLIPVQSACNTVRC